MTSVCSAEKMSLAFSGKASVKPMNRAMMTAAGMNTRLSILSRFIFSASRSGTSPTLRSGLRVRKLAMEHLYSHLEVQDR
ncbi:Uncharacterised protein [Mycobacteroides abscessus subsp. abscessus]|nr:Uncharacterised protein [Mycobacteroides abscessus subsp. abscessus]